MRVADPDIAKVLLSEETIKERVAVLGKQITDEYSRKLAPDGHLLVLELFRPRFRVLAMATAAWMACVARLFAGRAREDYAYLRASIGETCTAAEFGELATAAGFSSVQRFFLFPACSCFLFRRNVIK